MELEFITHYFVMSSRKYKGKTKAIGVYYGVKPFLLVTDPQLAKNIMITDFSHFTDTIAYKCDKDTDPFIGRNPNFMRGEEWKKGRNEIIPAFTKLRVSIPSFIQSYGSLIKNNPNQ